MRRLYDESFFGSGFDFRFSIFDFWTLSWFEMLRVGRLGINWKPIEWISWWLRGFSLGSWVRAGVGYRSRYVSGNRVCDEFVIHD